MIQECVFCNGTKVEPGYADCVWCDNTGVIDWPDKPGDQASPIARACAEVEADMQYQREKLHRIQADESLERQALTHIIKAVGQSRTSTRRLRWIAERAQWALDGKQYFDGAFDLPKNNEQSAEKLMLKCARLKAENETLQQQLAELQRRE